MPGCAAGRTAAWFVKNGTPGPIAIADIGYVGYTTGYRIVDMLGLLNRNIAELPGAYTRKVDGPYTDIVFGQDPRYFVIISSERNCRSPSIPSARSVFFDPRFSAYHLRDALHLKGGGSWCIYQKK